MITDAIAAGIQEHGSFTQFVLSVLDSGQLVQGLVLAGFGLAGVLANWYWKWVTDQITGSLWKYLAHDNPKRTLASLTCIGAWAIWAIDINLTWTQAINLALSTGFAIDVLVNKSTPAKATP